MAAIPRTLRVALCQTVVHVDKAASIAGATDAIARAAGAGAKLCVLPEMWCSLYQCQHFKTYEEAVPAVGQAADSANGPALAMLAAAARTHKLWLVGGSVPERAATGELYNTAVAVNPAGELVAKHRKVHLFDIDIPKSEDHPGIRFMESEVLTGGEGLETSIFDVDGLPVGIGICYDVRFPELALSLQARGAELIVFPGAFNQTTGPLHWELYGRARAVDCQAFIGLCSPARSKNPEDYQAYGHTMVVSPWGKVLEQIGEDEGMIVQDLNFDEVTKMRSQIPTMRQKRPDVYSSYAQLSEDARRQKRPKPAL